MLKWTVKFFMKNGDVIQGLYVGPEAETMAVARKLICGNLNNFVDLYGEDTSHHLFVKLGEIQAADITLR